MITASVTFNCHADGRVRPDVWANPSHTDPGTRNALAIERIVRVCMKAQGRAREGIAAAVDSAEKGGAE